MIHRHVLFGGFDGQARVQRRRRPDDELAAVLPFGQRPWHVFVSRRTLGDELVDGLLNAGDRLWSACGDS